MTDRTCDRCRCTDKRYRDTHKEEAKEYNKNYRSVNEEKKKECDKKFYAENRERYLEKVICDCGREVIFMGLSRHKKIFKVIYAKVFLQQEY